MRYIEANYQDIHYLLNQIASMENELEQYKQINYHIGLAIFQYARLEQGIPDYISDSALLMLGYTRAQFALELQNNLSTLLLPQDLPTISKLKQALRQSEQPIPVELGLQRRDGKPICLIGMGILVDNWRGNQCAVFAFDLLHECPLIDSALLKIEVLMRTMVGWVKVCKYDKYLTIVHLGEGICKLLGYSLEEIKNMTHCEQEDIMRKVDAQKAVAQMRQQLAEQGSYTVEYPIRRKDASTIWILDKGVLIRDANGNDLVESMVVNITVQKEREQLLLEKSAQLEAILENMQGGVQICKRDECSTMTYVNNSFCELTGYSKQEMQTLFNNEYIRLILPEDRYAATMQLQSQLEDSSKYSIEYRIKRKNGDMIWVLERGVHIQTKQGEELIQFVLTDISLQKSREEELMISQKRYEIAMRFTDVTIFDYNIKNRTITNHWSDLDDYTMPRVVPDGAEGIIARGIIQPVSVEAFRALYTKIHNGAPFAQAIVHALDKNRREVILDISLTTVYDYSAKPVRAVGVKKDITETMLLKKEKAFGKALASNKHLTYEANITKDRIISYDLAWAESLQLQDFSSYQNLVQALCTNALDPFNADYVRNKLSVQSLIDAYEAGNKMVSIEYRRKAADGAFHWFEQTVNVVRDDATQDLSIRAYVMDINDRKEKEAKVLDEQKFYETMVNRSICIYEVNVTRNLAISGHETWGKQFGIALTDNYDDMILALCEKALHPDDRAGFVAMYLRENVLKAYRQGEKELSYDYRRPDPAGMYMWVRCSMHLFEDPITEEVKGISYIEDINQEKCKEEELIYRAERDSLTGFFNKTVTEEKINAFLSSSVANLSMHVLFMIDIDHFKQINDNFGHVFGDAVLSQVSSRIAELFGNEDILGRIGGDEFVILMKNIANKKIALNKAQEICDNVKETYTQNSIEHHISTSIGIAYYDEHGKTYDELYSHADHALYVTKANGRNGFSVYSMQTNGFVQPIAKQVQERNLDEPKAAETNISQHVLGILFQATDKRDAIEAVLALLAKHYRASRAYLLLQATAAPGTRNVYEWCDASTLPLFAKMQATTSEWLMEYFSYFNSEGTFYVPTMHVVEPELQKMLEDWSIKSTVSFLIHNHGKNIGMIGFDYNDFAHPTSKTSAQLSDMRSAANILSMFVKQEREQKQTNAIKASAVSMINRLGSYAYVCDPNTYELLFVNEKAKALCAKQLGQAEVGQLCYRSLWNKSTPCETCPMLQLQLGQDAKSAAVYYEENLQLWMKPIASRIDWPEQRHACLIEMIDVTELKS